MRYGVPLVFIHLAQRRLQQKHGAITNGSLSYFRTVEN